ncbi:hypothetical protein HRbin15_02546 [bacterium HR15]|nr:hypothetical protein HRbin15_02546 [bacterium HR15]
MGSLWRSEAWRYRWLPLWLAVAGTIALFWLQEVGIFRRHALLLALLMGMGFFHPTLRHPLLILFGYGLSLYFLTKSLGTWMHMPFGGLGEMERWLWGLIGLMCGISALGMGRPTPPRWPVALLMFALGLYFVTYTYREGTMGNMLQVIAGAGLATVAFVAALVNAIEGWAHTRKTKKGILLKSQD